MYISDTAITKPVLTVVAMLMIVVFGIVALTQLDTDEYPEIDAPVVVIAVPYPGASPDIVEREVVDPIEEAISGISGIDRMRSSSLDSFANIVVEFDFSKDPKLATQEIRDKISAIRNDLPTEMEEPILTQFDPADRPIVSLTLSSPGLTGAELTRMADPDITRRLRGISGVATVNLVGAIERELVVEIRPRDLEATGVSVGQLVQALQSQNLASPVGRLEGALDERTIRLKGRVDSPSDFKQLVVSQSGGRVVRLGDLADVKDATEEPRSYAAYNDEEAVGFDILKSTGFSTTAVANDVRAKVVEIQRELPAGVTLRVAQDGGERVDASVRGVEEALIEGAVLTVAVVFLFLNSWRSTVITGLALPVSVLASFVAVWAFGFTLNTMSLLGLSLAIGILIDDAIVVRENIVRHVEMGKDHLKAAHEGTHEIGLAVTATTLSIVVVFIPIAFLGGMAGQWFKPFGLTIACSVLVSLFVSFSLDPMLSAYWPDQHGPLHTRWFMSRWLGYFNLWFDRQAERYKSVIAWALDHRYSMITLAVASFIGALALPAMGIIPAALVPIQDNSMFSIDLDVPPGSNLEYAKAKAQEVARIARKRPEVAYTYIAMGREGDVVDEGSVFVKLLPKAERSRIQADIEADIRSEIVKISGLMSAIGGGWNPGEKAIQIQLKGQQAGELTRLAQQVAAEMRQVPGAVDVDLSTKGQKPELEVQLDRSLAGSLGITVGQVAQALRPAFAGIDVGDWVDPSGETRDVTIRLAPASRTVVADLESMPLVVSGPDGTTKTIPLGQVARITPGLGPARIDHLDRDRVINVEANTEGAALSEVVNAATARIEQNVKFPAGYGLSQGGQTKDQQEIFTQMLLAIGVAVMLMYFVLVVQFGSFLEPFSILLSLPLSLIGVMLALYFTKVPLDIMSMIGVVLLVGIVAKNAILLIDFAKWSEEAGMERREALILAGRVRLRPILMTTFALVAGMIPVALGSGEGGDFRAPLGISVIGGVITSTLLTLLVIPTVYESLADTRDWIIARFKGEKRHHKKAHEPGAPLVAPDRARLTDA
ncbi:MAG TPA: efflux RND transporter permease subunit [Vicinamibacterales bacterium]|nr:efflux RND transporter permease subunit [Vicinamibacterales bacterium]